MGKGPPWTEEDLKLLRDNPWMTNSDLAAKLGRTANAVRIAKQNHLGIRTERSRVIWSAEDQQIVADNRSMPEKELAALVGRSVGAIRNERLRQRRESGAPARVPKHENIPEQDLWNHPPGVYVKTIGRLLLEDEEIMGHWLHAHGYSSFEITDEDPKGWITVMCVKEK